MIAIHTPVKRAAAVSPLEALRYSDYQGKMKESSVLHRKITPASLAKMNLSRQKAKSTLTILSLSLGGVLVVLISTMLVSYDGVAEARGRAFPVGEFNIQLNANQSWDTAGISLSGLQQKNFLNCGCYCRVLFFNQPCQYDNHKLSVPQAGNWNVTGDWFE